MGVQLELSRSLRDALMASRTSGGSDFPRFTRAVDRAIEKQIQQA
jgi:hypothetical protein